MNSNRPLSEAIPSYVPYDGPHSRDTVLDAGESVSALIRYLNNATGPENARHTLAWANTINFLLGYTGSTVYGLDQLLTQLATALGRQGDDSTLYDDRRDRPGHTTAHAASARLDEARKLLRQLGDVLDDAQRMSVHLGND